MRQWFEVDTEGLKELQLGKPKYFVLRELLQNAWDENITTCTTNLAYADDHAIISVADDCEAGFKDLADAYKLFGHTDKRHNAEKRGRFNFGEKQAFSICSSAQIMTTTGTVTFDDEGRHEEPEKRRSEGTIVQMTVPMTTEEYEEMLEFVEQCLPPQGITWVVNGDEKPVREPYKAFQTRLHTQIHRNGALADVTRKTTVELHELGHEEKAILYEMGLPVTEIDCDYHIDIQQKVPLNTDRDMVKQAFLQDLYCEVLNETYDDIGEDNSAKGWITTAMGDKRIRVEAIRTILDKRYGDKVVVANNMDPNSVDEAIAKGYHVIQGRQLPKEVWSRIRENELIPSSTALFGATLADAKVVKPTPDQEHTAKLARMLAKQFMGLELRVVFIECPESNTRADFNRADLMLRFNTSKFQDGFWVGVNKENMSLILHELGHFGGNHTEHSYHDTLTDLSAKIIVAQRSNPELLGEIR